MLALVVVCPSTPFAYARVAGGAPPTVIPETNPPVKVRLGGTPRNFVLAYVSDDVTAAGSITVTLLSAPDGVHVTNIVNTNGTITGDVSADCDATNGNQEFTLQASDGTLTTDQLIEITVQGNDNPTIGVYGPATVIVGDSIQATPSVPPSDSGTIEDLTVSIEPNTFTGTVAIDSVTGVVTITNAGPIGLYTISVMGIDNCNGSTTRTFTLDVQAPANQPPVANAGLSFSTDSCTFIGLSGASSFDPDNGPSPLTFSWSQTGGTPVTLYAANTALPAFEAPNVATFEDLTFQLVVSDSVAVNSATVTVTVNHVNNAHVDTVGLFVNGSNVFFTHNCNGYGPGDNVFTFGGPGFVPLAGDWDGDGDTTVGIYDPTTSCFFLRNENSTGNADIIVCYAAPGDVPIVGDWDGDGDDTIGVYRPATSEFFLRNSNDSGPAEIAFQFGAPGNGFVPLVGDWDGDGDDTIGLYAPSTSNFFLRNSNSVGGADLVFQFGISDPDYVPVTGNWDGLGGDSVGIYVRDTGVFFLSTDNAFGGAEIIFQFGIGGDFTPLVGNWDNL
jgi:hypothetical protein